MTPTKVPMTKKAGKGEFGRIRDYFAPLTEGRAGSFNLKDDAAWLDFPTSEHLVITTDMLVRGVHFLGDETPAEIAAKALRVNLSDLAGKGACPLAYSLGLALPSDVEDAWVEQFAAGLAEDQKRYGLYLLGGDSVSTPGPITISITTYGTIPKDCYPSRTAGRVGDHLYVSGTIGDGALGLLAARGVFGRSGVSDRLVERYRYPQPRIQLGQLLRGKVSASMDISDGLVGDLSALAKASGCCAGINSFDVPLSESAAALIAEEPSLLETALTGGDDYELLFAVPPRSVEAVKQAASLANTPIQQIGMLRAGDPSGDVFVSDREGKRLEFIQEKYTHT